MTTNRKDNPNSSSPETACSAPAQSDEAYALIVDDDDIVRNLLVKVLTAAGFKCLSSDSGERALDLLRDHSPIVAVLDIAMPGMNGAELAWRIRQIHPNIPLIAVSGKLQIWDVDDLRDLGFDHIYAKPLDCNDLVALCKSIRRSAAQRG